MTGELGEETFRRRHPVAVLEVHVPVLDHAAVRVEEEHDVDLGCREAVVGIRAVEQSRIMGAHERDQFGRTPPGTSDSDNPRHLPVDRVLGPPHVLGHLIILEGGISPIDRNERKEEEDEGQRHRDGRDCDQRPCPKRYGACCYEGIEASGGRRRGPQVF
ncbi:hypothetical protein DSECCO2_488000 [anaerobic digester metagenome]